MEKLNKKGIVGLVIAAIVIIAGVICLALINSGEKAATEEQLTAATKAYEEYVFSMTFGHSTQYNGIDILYAEDKQTYDTLHRNVILNVAAKYASTHLNNSITKDQMNVLRTKYNYDPGTHIAFNGEAVKEAIKLLFGKDWEHGSGLNDNMFGFNFDYIPQLDVYLRSNSKAYSKSNGLHMVDYKTIKAVKNKEKVILTVAIAYTHTIDNKVIYTSGSNSGDAIFETTKDAQEIQEEKINEFPKYKVTFNIDENNNYVFESIEKIK